MRKRRKLFMKLESSTLESRKSKIRQHLIKIELLLQASHAEMKQRKEQLAVKAIKTNPRFFFSYAKQFAVTKTNIGPLLNEKNEFTSSSYEMANILSKQYSSVFSVSSTEQPSITENSVVQSISDVSFTEHDIIAAIDELRNNSASGPDGISAIFLKKCKHSLATPLHRLWRDCLDRGITPSVLKAAHVIPVHKGGHQGVAANYRPIALTSHLIKVFEKVIRNKITKFLEGNNLFNSGQHRFRTGRSFLSQLLDHQGV